MNNAETRIGEIINNRLTVKQTDELIKQKYNKGDDIININENNNKINNNVMNQNINQINNESNNNINSIFKEQVKEEKENQPVFLWYSQRECMYLEYMILLKCHIEIMDTVYIKALLR